MSDKLYETKNFDDFWKEYQRLHSRRSTRLAHAAATSAAVILLTTGAVRRAPLLLVAAPLVDYGIAQLSHRLAEGNATQPFRRPYWHTRAELRLFRRTIWSEARRLVGRIAPPR